MSRELTAKELLKEVREIKKQAKLDDRYLASITKVLRGRFPDAELVRTYTYNANEVAGDYRLLENKETKRGRLSDLWVSVVVSTDPDEGASVESPVYMPLGYLHDPREGGHALDDELHTYSNPKKVLGHIVYDAKRVFGDF